MKRKLNLNEFARKERGNILNATRQRALEQGKQFGGSKINQKLYDAVAGLPAGMMSMEKCVAIYEMGFRTRNGNMISPNHIRHIQMKLKN